MTSQAPGTLRGQIRPELAAAGGLSGIIVSGRGIDGDNDAATPRAFDAVTDAEGRFEITDVAPGSYRVEVDLSQYLPEVFAVQVGIAEVLDLGTISMDVHRGAVKGGVVLEGAPSNGGALITARRIAGADAGEGDPALEAVSETSVSETNGDFGFTGLPVGRYELVASKEDFTPATSAVFVVDADVTTQVDALRLQQIQGQLILNDGARFTNSREVALLLDGFVAEAYRLSFDIGALDDVEWAPMPTSRTLPLMLDEGDGLKQIFAQFQDRLGAASRVFRGEIILDTTLPVGRSPQVVEGPVTNAADRTVTLELAATDSAGRIVEMELSEAEDFAGAVAEPFQSPRSFTLFGGPAPEGDGAHRIFARFADEAGNWSLPESTVVHLDRESPGLVLRLSGGAALTPIRSVIVEAESAEDATEIALRAGAEIDCATATWQPFARTLGWVLAADEGLQSVSACVRDAAGNISTGSDDITYDATPPRWLELSAPGGLVVATTTVALQLVAEGAESMRATGDIVLPAEGARWAPFASELSVELTPGDGEKRVLLALRDAAGNISDARTLRFLLDTLPPQRPRLVIEAGEVTASPQIRLRLSADGAATMRIDGEVENSAETFTDLPFAPELTVTLTAGGGAKIVRATFSDEAGNTSEAVLAETVLDQSAPGDALGESNTLRIEPALSRSADVALLAASDAPDVSQMQLSNDASLSGASWQLYTATPLAWRLPSGDGEHTVYARFRDAAGNVSEVVSSNPVTVDSTAPAAPFLGLVEGGSDVATLALTLALRVEDSGEGTQMWVDDNAAFDGGTGWIDFAPTLDWTLSDGEDGPRPLFARFADAAGNVSGIAGLELKLDRSPPQLVTLRINGGAALSASSAVELEIESQGAAQMQVACDGVLDGEAWIAAALSHRCRLLPGDGAREVALLLRDAAGNVLAEAATASIVVDTRAPLGTLRSLDGDFVATPELALELSGDDENGPVEVKLGGDLEGVQALDFEALPEGPRRVTLSAGDGAKLITAVFRDAAGNQSTPVSELVTLDTGAPRELSLRLAGGAALTRERDIEAQLFAVGATQLSLGGDILEAGETRAYAERLRLTLSPGDGDKQVQVRFIDEAGNDAELSATIHLDTTAPDTPLPTALPALSNDPRPLFQWSPVAGDALQYRLEVASSAAFGVPAFSALSAQSEHQPDAPLPDGRWFWRVAALDPAGNRSAWSAPGEFVIDTEAPLAPRALSPAPATRIATRTPALVYSDASGSGASRYEIELHEADTRIASAQSTQSRWTVDPPLESDGVFSWRVRACDAADNCSAFTESRSFQVDTVAPDAPAVCANSIDILPLDAALTRANLVVLSWPVVAPVGGDLRVHYNVEVEDDEGLRWASAEGLTEASYALDAGALPDGSFRWRVAASDDLGLRSPWSDARCVPAGAAPTFTLDRRPPAAPSVLAPVGGDVLADPQPQIRWTDESESGAVGYRLRIIESAGSTVVYESPAPIADISETLAAEAALSDGDYALSVACEDAVGNRSPFSASVPFVIDATPPGAPSQLIAPAWTRSLSPTFVWQPAADNFGLAGYEVELTTDDAFADRVQRSEVGGEVFTAAPLTPGRYFWRVRARDLAGNTSDWVSPLDAGLPRAFVVDTTPPSSPRFESVLDTVVNLAPHADPAQDNVFQIALAVPSAPGDTSFSHYELRGGHARDGFEELADFIDAGESGQWDGSTFTFHLISDSVNFLKVRAVDFAGNVSDEDFVRIDEDSQNPTQPTPATATGQFVNQDEFRVFLDAASTDDHFSHYEMNGGDLPDWVRAATFDGFAYPLTQDTPNTLQVRGVDRAGNRSEPLTILITEDSTPPVPPVMRHPSFQERPAEVIIAHFDAPAVDVNLDRYQMRGGPFDDWTDVHGMNALQIPLLGDQENTFRIRAVDKAGNLGEESNEIYFSEVSATAITPDDAFRTDPVTNGRLIAYEDKSAGGSNPNVVVYDTYTGLTHVVDDRQGFQNNMNFDGDRLVYHSYHNGPRHPHLIDFADCTVPEDWSTCRNHQLWDVTTVLDPDVSGDLVVWETGTLGNSDIFLLDLTDCAVPGDFSNCTQWRLTDAPSAQSVGRVSGRRVVAFDDELDATILIDLDLCAGPGRYENCPQQVIDRTVDRMRGSDGVHDIDGDIYAYTVTTFGLPDSELGVHIIDLGDCGDPTDADSCAHTVLFANVVTHVRVNGDTVVWHDFDGIYHYNVRTGHHERVGAEGYLGRDGDVGGDVVTWSYRAGSFTQIWTKRLVEPFWLTYGDNNVFNISMDGDRAIFTNNQDGFSRVWAYDFAARDFELLMERDATNISEPFYDGETLVWRQSSNLPAGIYVQTAGQAQPTFVPGTDFRADQIDHHAGRAVWRDLRSSRAEIYLFDAQLSRLFAIDTTGDDTRNPKISGTRVTYNNTSNREVIVLDLGDCTDPQELTGCRRDVLATTVDSGGTNVGPVDISGDRVVWADDRNGDADIFIANLSNCPDPNDWSSCPQTNLTQAAGDQLYPRIDGDIVTWSDRRSGTADIWYHDLGTGQQGPITLTPAHFETVGAVSNRRVCWQDRTADDNGIDISCAVIPDPTPQ